MTRFGKFEHYGAGEPIWIAADQVVSVWADGQKTSTTIRTTCDRQIMVEGAPEVIVARLTEAPRRPDPIWPKGF